MDKTPVPPALTEAMQRLNDAVNGRVPLLEGTAAWMVMAAYSRIVRELLDILNLILEQKWSTECR